MRKLCFFLLALSATLHALSQDDIQLDLDSIKNIKTTRYSSVNEVGIGTSGIRQAQCSVSYGARSTYQSPFFYRRWSRY
jgi:hypothetical protein